MKADAFRQSKKRSLDNRQITDRHGEHVLSVLRANGPVQQKRKGPMDQVIDLFIGKSVIVSHGEYE